MSMICFLNPFLLCHAEVAIMVRKFLLLHIVGILPPTQFSSKHEQRTRPSGNEQVVVVDE